MKNKINKNYLFLDTVLFKLGSDLKNNLNLKQALRIIHMFNSNNKTIWFVGFDKKFKLNNKHVFLPIHLWSKGTIGNKKFVKTKISNLKDPDLVIILNCKSVTNEVIKEFVMLNVPIIMLGSVIKLSLKSCYIKFVHLNLEKKFKQFFSFILYSVLKKTKKVHEKKYI